MERKQSPQQTEAGACEREVRGAQPPAKWEWGDYEENSHGQGEVEPSVGEALVYWRLLARGEGRDLVRSGLDLFTHSDSSDVVCGSTLG